MHAFLVMAHRDDFCFRTLLKLLDDERNRVFIHMDSKLGAYDEREVELSMLRAEVIHTPRISVTWGGYSQIQAEVLLLKTAVDRGEHSYYHLLSGQDLPIKSQNVIHAYFQDRCEEFVAFATPAFEFDSRVQQYHPIWNHLATARKHPFLRRADTLLTMVQRALGVRRFPSIEFQKGSFWSSITHPFATYVCERSDWIERIFSSSLCGDELYLQTLLINSSFRDNLHYHGFWDVKAATKRLIDWKRGSSGSPYTWKSEDLDEVLSSNCLFARKFDPDVDSRVIESIYGAVV